MYLGRDVKTGQLVEVALDALLRGTTLIGKPGTGKTTEIEIIIDQYITNGGGVCYLDPHRDSINNILSRIPASREQDVILLDLVDETVAPGLNLFECQNPRDKDEVSRVTSAVLDIFGKLFSESGDLLKDAPTMAETLLNTIPVLLSHQNPRMSMAEIPLLLMDETARKKLLASITDPYVKSFWTLFDRMKRDDQEALTGSTRRRVGNFLLDSLSREIVGQAMTTIPFRTIMDESKILLVKLSRQHSLITSLVGGVIVAKIALAAYSRSNIPEEQRVPFLLACDEYQVFSTPTYAQILTECRKFKLASVVAFQARGMLDQKNRIATLNAGTSICFQISGQDASELAQQFDATPPPPEIIGWRPILTPKSDVVGHLRTQGHVHHAICSFVQSYLAPALRIVEANKRYAYNIRVSPRPGEPKRKVLITDLDEAINQLNALFFAVSVEKNSDIDIPPLVFMMFARLFGFSGDRFFGFGGFATYITMYDYFRNEQRSTIFHPKKELLLLCTPAYLSHKDEIAQKISPHVLTPALAFVTSLRKTMQVLAVDPVLISTGQHQPIFDKPRSYADVQAEIASTLANLPRFTAKIKLAGDNAKPEEHIIRTISPNELHVPRLSLAAFAQRIERIKQHNIQQGYLRLRVDIEKEITERQKTLLDSDKGKQTKQDDED